MKIYRLYSSKTEKGITPFEAESYIILQQSEDNIYHIVLNTKYTATPFILTKNLQFHNFNSIDWDYGKYFTTLKEAYETFIKITAPFDTPFIEYYE